MTAVQPPGRFGALDIDRERVRELEEKPPGDGGWTNGGFFVLSPGVGGCIDGDDTVWEQEPMRALALRRASSPATATAGSGGRWTRCAIATTSSGCGLWERPMADLVLTT